MIDPHFQAPAEFGLARNELRFVVVGPEWAARFEEKHLRIAEALGPIALDIQLAAAAQAGGDRDRYQELKSPFIENFQDA